MNLQPIGHAARIAALEALYAELPHVECKRLCRECCGQIWQVRAMTPLESDRIEALQQEPPAPDAHDFMRCTWLDGGPGLCTVYELRPLICRLWGVVQEMRCPFGCVPDRWLTDDESKAFMRRAVDLGGNSLMGVKVPLSR